MLESVLADVLTRVLGQYLKGIDRDNVRFGAWSGLVELRGVALRPEALAVLFETLGLDLPVTVEAGFIGLLRLQVPWNAIGTTPVQVHMSDITIMARPVSGDGSDDSELQTRERRIKRAKLDTDDAVREAAWGVTADTSGSSWGNWLLSEQLRAKIVDNIQIHLSGILLRFEDPFSDPRRPYIASVVCDSLKAVSANANWQEAFVERSTQAPNAKTRKLLEAKGFRIDWAPITPRDAPGLSRGTSSGGASKASRFETPELLKQFMTAGGITQGASDTAENSMKSILQPVDGSIHLSLSTNTASTTSLDSASQDPSVDLDIRLPDVAVDLDDVQYACILQTSVYFAKLSTRGFRPKTPRERWLWAIDQLLPGFSQRRERALRFTEKGICAARDRRVLYIAYRKSVLKARRMSVEEPSHIARELELLEDSFLYEEVLALRDAVDRQIEIEGEDWKPVQSKAATPKGAESSGTTINSFWQMLGYEKEQESTRADSAVQRNEETKSPIRNSKLATAIREKTDVANAIALRVAFYLRSATIRLSENGFPNSSVRRVALNLNRLRCGLLLTANGDLTVEALLGSIEAWDFVKQVKMVYCRFSSTSESLQDGSEPTADCSYPRDVEKAIESIRSGSNPAKELLDDGNSSDTDDGNLLPRNPLLPTAAEHNSSTRRHGSISGSRDCSPISTFHVTQKEFLGSTAADVAGSPGYIAAFRYVHVVPSDSDISKVEKSTLDVSVATLEAIIDGPKGSFVWGLKFWRPKGIAQDPITALLGAAAGARIAELRMEVEEALLANKVPMQINAVIQAPRFIFPSSTESSSAIIVNMGTLGICTSDSTRQDQYQQANQTKGRLRYSSYVLTLDDLGVYFSPNLSIAISQDRAATSAGVSVDSYSLRVSPGRSVDTTMVERIIRPFSLRFILQTLRDSSMIQVANAPSRLNDSESQSIAKVRVRGNIPGLYVILTQEALQHLLVEARRWSAPLQPRNDDHGKESGHRSLNIGWQPTRGSESEEALICPRPDQFGVRPEDLRSQTHSSTSAAHITTAMASFDVNVIMQKVSFEIRESMEACLITAVASGMVANIVKTGRLQLCAEFSLQSWSVTDESRGSDAAFRRLVYAGTAEHSEEELPPRNRPGTPEYVSTTTKEDKNFVNILYNLNLIANEQKIHFKFLSLNMVCVRETYVKLASFFYRTLKSVKETIKGMHALEKEINVTKPEVPTAIDHPTTVGIASEQKALFGETSVISEFDGFNLQLIASGGAVVLVEMKDSKIQLSRNERGDKKVWGDFQYFCVQDCTAPISEHVSVITYEQVEPSNTGLEQEILSDQWTLDIPSSEAEHCHFRACFKGINICFLYRFSLVVQQYFSVLQDGIQPAVDVVMEQVSQIGNSDETVERTIVPPSRLVRLEVDVDLNDLNIRVPRHSGCASEALVLKISKVHITNAGSASSNVVWNTQIETISCAAEYVLPPIDRSGEVPRNVSAAFWNQPSAMMTIHFGAVRSKVEAVASVEKAWLVDFTCSDPVLFELCEAQYTVAYFVLTENLEETIRERNISTDVDRVGKIISLNTVEKDEDSLPNQELNTRISKANDLGDIRLPQGNEHIRRKTVLDMDILIPVLTIELSRGWDVTQSSCKVLGLYISNAKIDFTYSMPSHMFGQITGNVLSMADLRLESATDGTFAAPLSPMTMAESTEGKENVTMTYEKEAGCRTLIAVCLAAVRFQIVPELFRDLTCLAVPGWPYLSSSAQAPDYVYLGRSMTAVLGNSQVLLPAEEDGQDSRGLLFMGEFHVKVDWMKGTGAKRISLQSTQLEVSTVYNLPRFRRALDGGHHHEYEATQVNELRIPLFYPTDSLVEYVDPDIDEAGCRLHISADAILCLVNAAEIPLLKTVACRSQSLKSSYLQRREWVQEQMLMNEDESRIPDPKEERIRKAREKLNVSITVPTARYLVTDVGEGRFVPILEARLKSFEVSAHLGNIIQVEGELAMDLYNTEKGWWEPAVEPWSVSASMSNGQSGTRAIVVKSEQRLNINITPITVTATMTVAKALRNATAISAHQKTDISAVHIVKERNLFSGESLKAPSTVRRPTVAAFLVRNELGVPITMSRRRASHKTTIAHLEEVEVGVETEDLVSASENGSSKSREEALKCILIFPGMVTQELSASEVGKHYVTLVPSKEDFSSPRGDERYNEYFAVCPLRLVWEVEMINGVPVCTVRSLVRLVNETGIALQIRFSSEGQQAKQGDEVEQYESTIEPGFNFSVPVYYTNVSVQVRPKASNLFGWSTPLPKLSSLYQHASEIETSVGEPEKYSRSPSPSIKHFAVRCKTAQSRSSDFFVSFAAKCPPNSDPRPPMMSTWIDIDFRAPVSLRNSLPNPLSYRITYRSTSPSVNPQTTFYSEGAVLAAGVIAPQQLAHLHFSSENLKFVFLALAYENAVTEPLKSASSKSIKRALAAGAPSRFGPEVSFGAMEGKKVPVILPSADRSLDSKGQIRRDLRATIMPSVKGLPHFEVFSGFWVRNRSDTALEVCSRGSYYGAGSQLFSLKENPPSQKPNPYVCLEGPYLSIRLSKRSRSESNDDTLDHSEWWTSPSVLQDINKPIAMSVRGRSLEVDVRTAIGLESHTYIITIRNMSWICNNTPSILQWCDSSALDAHGNCIQRLVQTLRPSETRGIHWNTRASQKAVHIRIADELGQSDWIWSPAVPLNIGHSRELPAKMYRPKTHEQYIARVASKKLEGKSRALVIYPEDRHNPPYRIVNLCQERAIAFSQIGSLERPWLVRAGKSTRYSWDNPLVAPDSRLLSLRVLEVGDTGMERKDEIITSSSRVPIPHRHEKAHLNIDVVGDRAMVLSESYNPTVVISVSVDGATKIVTFCDEDKNGNILVNEPGSRPSLSVKESADSAVPTVAWDDIGHETEKSSSRGQNDELVPPTLSDYPAAAMCSPKLTSNREQIDTDTAIFLDSIGISVITREPVELMYMSLKGILVNYEAYDNLEGFAFHVKAFQVDNQLLKTPYPVLIWGSNATSAPVIDPQNDGDAISIEIQRTASDDDIVMIKSLKGSICPLNISFEDDFISTAIRFLEDTSLVGSGTDVESLSGPDCEQLTFNARLPGGSDYRASRSSRQDGLPTSRRIYVHDFRIKSTSLKLTSKGSGAAVAKAAGINSSARALVAVVLNVENCQFLFPSLQVQNVFDSLHHFAILVREYYVTQLTNQRMKLLASNALVGNPAALFNAVGTGARDFFTEPGRAKGSADFIASVGRGSKSFLTHTVGGLVESVSSIPRAVSSGLEKAVGDNDYLAERERIRGSNLPSGHRASSAKNPAQGLATGALSFAHGISSGVTGLIREPVQGARQGGAGGLLKGIGKAFIGGVAKPVAGAIDLVAEPAAGLSRQIADGERSGKKDIEEIPGPERPPRSFGGRNQRLCKFDRRMSVGMYLYRMAEIVSGVSFGSELMNWIELSDRPGRTGSDSEVWVWNVVQGFSRTMPGMKKQIRPDARSRNGPNSQSLVDSRPEKIRIALVTMTIILVVTLDCKIVTAIPLWGNCLYDIIPEGKEVLLRTTMRKGGDAESSSDMSSVFSGTQALFSAPWDASVIGRRRRPAPGEYTVDRIPSGSMEARDDLVTCLRHVTTLIIQEQGLQEQQSLMPRQDPNEQGSTSTVQELSADELSLQQLVEIGFKLEDAVSALAEAGGDLVKAVDILTSK